MTVYLGGTVCVCVCLRVHGVVWCVCVCVCMCMFGVHVHVWCVCVRAWVTIHIICVLAIQMTIKHSYLSTDHQVTSEGKLQHLVAVTYSDIHKSNPHTPRSDGCKSPTYPSLNYTHNVTSLTSNCAELSVLVLWSYPEAIVQDCDLCFMRQVTGRGILWDWNPADWFSQWDGCDVLCPWTSTAELTLAPISVEHTCIQQSVFHNDISNDS